MKKNLHIDKWKTLSQDEINSLIPFLEELTDHQLTFTRQEIKYFSSLHSELFLLHFIHPPTKIEFLFVPGGNYCLGVSPNEAKTLKDN